MSEAASVYMHLPHHLFCREAELSSETFQEQRGFSLIGSIDLVFPLSGNKIARCQELRGNIDTAE